MGIINSMKKMIAGASARLHRNVLGGTAAAMPEMQPMPDIVETATPPMPDTSRYRHVSVPLYPIDNPHLRKLLGAGYTTGAGQTHNIGNNAMKREADRIAESLGMNNKQRCLLRTKIKRRSEELRGAAEVWS